MSLTVFLTAPRAQPVAFSLLTNELTQYLERIVPGRSILISGHRGAGKTTLVNDAIAALHEASDPRQRLLKVFLYGPNLFTPPAAAPPPSDGASTNPQPAAPTGSQSAGTQETVAVLKEITVAL